MNIIDQRILIPTPPEAVWDYISEITNNPNWQADCRSVSFLTLAHKGAACRWRYTTKRGREYVVEITAWYDRLGYEYKIIDGGSYKENKGRIRLQEAPEGTIVQWTFHYELNGFLSGIRNAISTRRNIENGIVNSLWALWKRITEEKAASNRGYISKSLMREAPNAEARSQYKPRHALAVVEPESKTRIPEPAITQDDTRPNLVIAEKAAPDGQSTESPFAAPKTPQAQPIQQETVKKNLFEPVTKDHIEPEKLPVIVGKSPESDDFIREPLFLKDTPEEILPPTPEPKLATKEPPAPAVPTRQEIESPSIPLIETVTEKVDSVPELMQLPEIDPDTDTSQISVFDLFGVQKPSQEKIPEEKPSAHVVKEETVPAAVASVASITQETLVIEQQSKPHSRRVGLRLKLRQQRLRLRPPQWHHNIFSRKCGAKG